MNLKSALSAFALLTFAGLFAAENTSSSPKITPSGRILMDGALYASPSKADFPDGVAIPEVRIGVKFRYDKWSAAIDAGYAYNKVGLRNIWIEYGFNPDNSLRIGNFIHQYGLQSTSSSQKSTMEQPLASALFTPGIQLGAMYVCHKPAFYAAASVFVESNALKEVMNSPLFNQQGYGLLTRLVWRKGFESGAMVQAGASGGFSTPQRRLEGDFDVHDGFAVSANFPTKVAQVKAIGTTVTNSKNLFKFTPEILLVCKRMAFEGQYFFQQINRRDALSPFRTQSGYATLRGLILGRGYSYSSSTAQLANPAPGSLECVANYNYSTLSDSRAGIYGGRANSFGMTLNYYFNPYITGRLNYTYTHTWDGAAGGTKTLNGFQARIMLLF